MLKLLASFNRGWRVVKEEFQKRGVGYVFGLTALVIFLGAAGMAYFENPQAVAQTNSPSQVKGLNSYWDALWWTAMIMTTIGSEYWPVTLEGRILGFLISIYAFSVFGYITATLTSLLLGSKEYQDREVLQLQTEIQTIKEQVEDLRKLLSRKDEKII